MVETGYSGCETNVSAPLGVTIRYGVISPPVISTE